MPAATESLVIPADRVLALVCLQVVQAHGVTGLWRGVHLVPYRCVAFAASRFTLAAFISEEYVGFELA